jgi:hypothetical protein
MQKHRCYNIQTNTISQSQLVPVHPKCNGWVVINKGTTIVTAQGVPLLPAPAAGVSGESYGVAGNTDEIFQEKFLNINIVAPATGQSSTVVVIQKYFTD